MTVKAPKSSKNSPLSSSAASKHAEFVYLHQEELVAAEPVVEERLAEVRAMPDMEEALRTLKTTARPSDPKKEEDGRRREEKRLAAEGPVITAKKRVREVHKAAAQAALLMGQPISQIAFQYGFRMDEISTWKDVMITTGAVGRRDRLSDMLVVFVEQEIKSLMAISIVTSEEKWINKQNAGDLATYVAVKSDRLLQVLQAFGRVTDSRDRYVQQLEVIDDES